MAKPILRTLLSSANAFALVFAQQAMIDDDVPVSLPPSCPYCNGTSFSRLTEVTVKLASGAATDAAQAPRFDLVVCDGCGKTDWFTAPRAARVYWRMLGGKVEDVNVGTRRGGPFR